MSNRSNLSNWRILYWLFVGALLGFGFIAILSIGSIFVLAGLGLLIFGAIRFGGSGLWAALFGFGAAPAALLIWDVTAKPWACDLGGPGQSGVSAQPGVNYYTCVDTFVGPLTTYHVMAAGFGALALLGLLIGMVLLLRQRRRFGGGRGVPA